MGADQLLERFCSRAYRSLQTQYLISHTFTRTPAGDDSFASRTQARVERKGEGTALRHDYPERDPTRDPFPRLDVR